MDLNESQNNSDVSNNITDNNTSNDTEELNNTNVTNGTNSSGINNTNSSNINPVKYNFAKSGKVTLTQVKNAASSLKNYIAKNSKLPNYVTVGKYKVSVPQFSYLMACAIKNIKAKHTKYKINIIPITAGEITGDYVIKTASTTTYLKWVNKIVTNGKKNKKINSYITFDKKKLALKDYTNAFAKILAYYKSKKRLPKSVSIETFVITKKPIIRLGSNSLGKVEFIGPFGNVNSSIKIAYCIGVHVREYQAHNALYYTLNTKESSLKYCYYVYRITLAKVTGSYSKDRMSGQKLAQKYVLPHASKQNYSLFVDIHSTVGKAYKHSYFVFVPGNKNKQFIKLAKTIVSNTKKMVYYNPPSQTSPKYLTLPLVNKGTPTFVFETLTGESYKTTLSKLNSLVKNIDKLFG